MSEPSNRRRGRTIALAAGVGVALLGGTVLTGWLLHNEALKIIIPGADKPIRPNIAAGMLLCGTILSLLSRKTLTNPIRVGTAAIAATVIILSALTVGEYAFGWDLGIEHWLLGETPAALPVSHSGRMSPITALGFVLVGIALFAASRGIQKRLRLPLVGGLGGALIPAGGVPLAGFILAMLFGSRSNYMGTDASGIAGAFAFFWLGIGLLALLRGNGILTWSLGVWTTVGFAIGLALMILVTGLTYSLTVKMQQTAVQVGQAQEIRRQLEEIQGNLSDLERDQRSFIITANERLLEEWDAKEFEVRDHFGKLQRFQADYSHRQPLLRQFAALVSKRIDWANQTIKARRELGFPAAQEMVANGIGVQLLEQSRGLIKAIEDDENAHLRESQIQSEMASRTAFLMLPLGVFLCFTILSLVLFFLNAGMAQRRQAEEKYRCIFQNALEGIFQSTPNGAFLAANPAFAQMLGFATPDELIRERQDIRQQSYSDPAKRLEFKRMLEENGIVNDFEFEVKRKDGSTIWLSEDVRIVRDSSGDVLYYEGSAQDITKRKHTEDRILAILESAIDSVITMDHQGRVLEFNPAAEKTFGYKRDEAIGQLLADLIIPPSLRDGHQRGLANYLATGAGPVLGKRVELTGMRSDKSEFPLELAINRIGSHEPPMFTGFIRDITERKQAEQKLVEQANLLNLSQDAIMVRDMDDRIEFWNYGSEVLYGWTAEEARGRLSGDFLHYEEPVKILAERTMLETGGWTGECRHLTKQGGSVIVRSRWTLVRDEHGQPKSKLVIMTDITEQKKIEEQFLRAQRLESIGTLASGVAHDLNNILVPIMMAAPVLRGNIDSVERERFLDIVETSAQRGADIIKQVLTFARGADGDRILLQPIYLLEEVSKIASQTFPKSIALRTCYDENIHSLEADPTQLHQVLLNLCINARDAMPNGGELCLGAENFYVDEHYAKVTPGASVGPHVMLQVTDSGSGIPSDVIDKIFDPFFTTKSVGQGTGLGLSTVVGIVKSYGGFIKLYSEPGHTSFKIFLPAKANLDTPGIVQADALVPRGNGETVLLVDDEAGIREVAEVILKDNGYNPIVAEDGPSALALFARQMGHIAVVVTDLAMPGMDGLMLVHTLRQMEPGLKIIVSTGRTDDSHSAEITALRVDGCLTKPYTSRNLLLKLSHVLYSGMQDAA